MPVTEIDLRKQIRRLEAVYRAPKPTDELVASWAWVLSDVEPGEPMGAVSDYARSPARYFPTPGQIREAALLRRVESGGAAQLGPRSWNQTLKGPCPVCGAVLRMLKPEEQVQFGWDEESGKFMHMGAEAQGERFGVLHDRRKHESAHEPAIGYWK